MADSKTVQFHEPVMEEEEKVYAASGGIILSVSNKNLQLPMQEEGVALLGAEDVNRYASTKEM